MTRGDGLAAFSVAAEHNCRAQGRAAGLVAGADPGCLSWPGLLASSPSSPAPRRTTTVTLSDWDVRRLGRSSASPSSTVSTGALLSSVSSSPARRRRPSLLLRVAGTLGYDYPSSGMDTGPAPHHINLSFLLLPNRSRGRRGTARRVSTRQPKTALQMYQELRKYDTDRDSAVQRRSLVRNALCAPDVLRDSRNLAKIVPAAPHQRRPRPCHRC